MPDNKARHERAAVGTEAVSRDSARSPQSRDGRVRFEPGGIRPNTEPGPAPRPLIADVAAGIQPQPAKPAKVVAVNSDGQPAHDASIESGENKGEGAQEAGNVAVEQEPIELTPEELAAIVAEKVRQNREDRVRRCFSLFLTGEPAPSPSSSAAGSPVVAASSLTPRTLLRMQKLRLDGPLRHDRNKTTDIEGALDASDSGGDADGQSHVNDQSAPAGVKEAFFHDLMVTMSEFNCIHLMDEGLRMMMWLDIEWRNWTDHTSRLREYKRKLSELIVADAAFSSNSKILNPSQSRMPASLSTVEQTKKYVTKLHWALALTPSRRHGTSDGNAAPAAGDGTRSVRIESAGLQKTVATAEYDATPKHQRDNAILASTRLLRPHMSTFDVDTGLLQKGFVTAARAPDGSMEYAVTFSTKSLNEANSCDQPVWGGGSGKHGSPEKNSLSFRNKKTFPLRGLLIQIDNSIFRRQSHGEDFAPKRPEVSTEAVLRSTQLARRLRDFEEVLKCCLQYSSDVIASPEYRVRICCEVDRMLENARWKKDCLAFRLKGLQAEDMTQFSKTSSAVGISQLDQIHVKREHWRLELQLMMRHLPMTERYFRRLYSTQPNMHQHTERPFQAPNVFREELQQLGVAWETKRFSVFIEAVILTALRCGRRFLQQATYSLKQASDAQTEVYQHFFHAADAATAVAIGLEEMPILQGILCPDPPLFARWMGVGGRQFVPTSLNLMCGRAANTLLLRRGVQVLDQTGNPNLDALMQHPDFIAVQRSWGRFEALFCGVYAVREEEASATSSKDPYFLYVDWIAPFSRVVQRVTEFHVCVFERRTRKQVARIVVDNPSKPACQFTSATRAQRKYHVEARKKKKKIEAQRARQRNSPSQRSPRTSPQASPRVAEVSGTSNTENAAPHSSYISSKSNVEKLFETIRQEGFFEDEQPLKTTSAPPLRAAQHPDLHCAKSFLKFRNKACPAYSSLRRFCLIQGLDADVAAQGGYEITVASASDHGVRFSAPNSARHIASLLSRRSDSVDNSSEESAMSKREISKRMTLEAAAVEALHNADGGMPNTSKGFDALPHEALVHNQRRFQRFHDLLHVQVLEWQLRSQLTWARREQFALSSLDHPPNALTLETVAMAELIDLMAVARASTAQKFVHRAGYEGIAWPSCLEDHTHAPMDLENNPSTFTGAPFCDVPTSLRLLIEAALAKREDGADSVISRSRATLFLESLRDCFVEIFEHCLFDFALQHCSAAWGGAEAPNYEPSMFIHVHEGKWKSVLCCGRFPLAHVSAQEDASFATGDGQSAAFVPCPQFHFSESGEPKAPPDSNHSRLYRYRDHDKPYVVEREIAPRWLLRMLQFFGWWEPLLTNSYGSGLTKPVLLLACATFLKHTPRWLVQTIASSQGWLDEIIHVLVVGFEQDSDALPPAWFCDNDAAIVTTFNTIPPHKLPHWMPLAMMHRHRWELVIERLRELLCKSNDSENTGKIPNWFFTPILRYIPLPFLPQWLLNDEKVLERFVLQSSPVDIPDWLALRFHEAGPWHTEHACTQHIAAILAQDDRRHRKSSATAAKQRDTPDRFRKSKQRPLRMRKARSDLAILRKTLDSSTRLSRNSQAVLLNGGAAAGTWSGSSESSHSEKSRVPMEVPDWVRTNTAVLSALLRTLGAGDVPRWVCEECCRSSSLFETLERDGLLQRCRPSDVQKLRRVVREKHFVLCNFGTGDRCFATRLKDVMRSGTSGQFVAHNKGHEDKTFDGTPLSCYWTFQGRWEAFDGQQPSCPVCVGKMIPRQLPDEEVTLWACRDRSCGGRRDYFSHKPLQQSNKFGRTVISSNTNLFR